jgi:alanyl-tRNA synthetase
MLSEINNIFANYYQKQGFQHLPRTSLLDPTIPMSFVMSAGLVQVEKALASLPYQKTNKYVLVQDCFRHFDIEKVGQDEIHLSFFNMPGAFVFGDISPDATIQAMWNLSTNILGINPKHLWASYFAGGEIFGCKIPPDLETCKAWLQAGLAESHIIGLSKEHNFWIQGNGFQGKNLIRKCGANTELFYDRGKERTCGPNCRPGCCCGRFLEFSNSLFIRFEIEPATSKLHRISMPFTETVIGSERICMLLENVASVFDMSVYQPIICSIRQFIGSETNEDTIIKTSEYVVADHIRALYRLVGDGAPPPGKDGRQRIIKVLIRRVITYQFVLGISSKSFIQEVIDCAESGFPIEDQHQGVKEKLLEYIALEKERYHRTIERGHNCINRLITQSKNGHLTAKQIDELEQYWGMPKILTTNFVSSIHTSNFPRRFAFSTNGD